MTEGARRGLPPRPRWVNIAFIAGLLLVAFIVARACQENDPRISKEDAVLIARERIDYEPGTTMIRFLRRGVPSRPHWAVSFRPAAGQPGVAVTIVVDADSGEIVDLSS